MRKGADREAAAQKAAAVREGTLRAVAALEAVKADIAAEYVAMAARDGAAYTKRDSHAWKYERGRKVAAARETAEAVRVAIEAAEFRGDLAEFSAANGVGVSVDGTIIVYGGDCPLTLDWWETEGRKERQWQKRQQMERQQ